MYRFLLLVMRSRVALCGRHSTVRSPARILVDAFRAPVHTNTLDLSLIHVSTVSFRSHRSMIHSLHQRSTRSLILAISSILKLASLILAFSYALILASIVASLILAWIASSSGSDSVSLLAISSSSPSKRM